MSFLTLSLIILPSLALAQVDASAAGTVNSDSGWDPDEAGHYVHKKSAKKSRALASEDDEDEAGPKAPTANISVNNNQPMTRPMQEPTPEASPSPTPVPQAGGFTNHVRDLVLGGDPDLVQSYRNFLDKQDIRKNFFEFSLATGYFYNSSNSPFFTRNYNDAAPSVDLGADIWLSPFFGVDAEYRTTLLNELNDSPTGPATVNISQSWLNLGIKFRRFFGMSANSSFFTSTLRYADFSTTVPSVSHMRVSQDTQGLEFDFDLTVPTGKRSSFNIGFMLEPLANQNEHTGAAITSGTSSQTVGAGGNIGFNYEVSRQMIGFIKLSSLLYKTEFSGNTSISDPVAAIPLTNVPVTNAFYLLEFGLKLGR